ncbi:MAG TPA: hypothetical protein GX506_07270 [Firmicutes bacterium]|nr:hypothetical protein [Bacillota bacterium]
MRRWIFIALGLLIITAGAAVARAEEPGAINETVTIQPAEMIQAAQPDYKSMYFEALKRIEDLEAVIQQAIDLAKGYRSDWEEQRDIAEARKAQVDQIIKLSDTLMALIQDMKDTIDRQHEIILRLTQPKSSVQIIGGAVLHPKDLSNSGILLGLGLNF